MTKVEAIKKVMSDFNGVATWEIIYNNIEKYHPNAKKSKYWDAGIRGVLYREIKNNRNFKKIYDGSFALIDYDENNLYIKSHIYSKTENEVLSKIRVGQAKFRINLLKILKKCPITEINERKLLVASHIKPWVLSKDEERLDINNGLILSATIDRLFDTGLITFTKDRTILISKQLSIKNTNRLGISQNKTYEHIPIKNREKYLNFHYTNVFLK